MKSFFLALSFLTVLPIPPLLWQGEERIERALAWFPLVGAIIGALSNLFYGLLTCALPAKGAFILSLFFYHLLNGGLHLDGLADFSDAFFGAKKDEHHFRKILKDSRIGAMGVLALIFYFLSIYSVSENIRINLALFIALGMSGRVAIVVFATRSKSLFQEGLGRLFIEKSGFRELFIAIFIYILFMSLWGVGFLLTALSVLLASLLFRAYILRRFGGFSGDIFGAGCSLIEVLLIMTLTKMG